jgi:uncharacterized BrkB/YihY/UPF0761 family membrane protein
MKKEPNQSPEPMAVLRTAMAHLERSAKFCPMKTLRIVLVVLLGIFALPIIARLVGIGVALVRDFSSGATHASYLLGSFVGTLLVLAVFAWLITYLPTRRSRNQALTEGCTGQSAAGWLS